jgi:transposase
MWTPATRQQHSRPVTRYQTDLTDAEWRVIAPHLPKPCATGRPREWPMREIINGIFYVMRAGCSWRLLPNDLPPWGTIYRWFADWRDDGRINHAARASDRSCFMTFETDSQCEPPERLFSHFVSFLGGIVRTSNGMSLGQSSLDLAERVFM